MNFKNFNDATTQGEAGIKPLENDISLSRQTSIYSLTFDEFQNTLGGNGMDFGSMNMDDFLKNIWTAEESQAMAVPSTGFAGGDFSENLQRQGSLKLPRTISQMTVDEVFRDLMKDPPPVAKDGGVSNMPQRQPTLGEITLEDFLFRAGVVREDMQPFSRPNNGRFNNGNIVRQNYNNGVAIDFQQQNRNIVTTVPNQVPGLPLGGVVSQQQLPPRHQQPPLFPKQTNLTFASPVPLMNTELTASGARAPRVGMVDPSMNNNNLISATGLQNAGMGMVGLARSPVSQVSPDFIGKCGIDTPSLSPVPYAFGRGRKRSAALEKVVERRQRRMIKNRESAARSRARKQAYTLELEAEIATLKELNDQLHTKQQEIMEMQKNQLLEKMNQPWRKNGECLKRTLTGPW
ncbi:hypothetical protein ACFE04_022815 [Oxalis oulophora]